MDYYGAMFFASKTIRPLAWMLAPAAALTWNSAALSQTSAERAVRAEAKQAAERGALFYETLLGELNVQAGQPQVGYALLLQAARRSGDARLYQRAVELALQSRSGEHALQAARAWKAALPDSSEANRSLLQISIALNQIADTGPLLKQVLAQSAHDERQRLLRAVPGMYARASDKPLAASVIEQGLEESLSSPDTRAVAWTALGFAKLAAGQTQQALEAAKEGGTTDNTLPDNLRLLLALMQTGVPEAETTLKARTAHRPMPADLRLAYADLLTEHNRLRDAETVLQETLLDLPSRPEPWLALARLSTRSQQWDKAEQAARQALNLMEATESAEQQEGLLSETWLLLASVAEKKKDYAGAAQWLDRLPPSASPVRTASLKALLLARQGQVEKARSVLQALPDQEPLLKLQLEIQLLQELQQFDEALALQTEWVRQQPDDPDVQYNQAMLAEKAGRLGQAEALLRGLIERHPNYHHAYNALGYLLTQRNDRLQEAKQLILKALKFAPHDPLITDSLGWVEYRLGNPQEALRLLEAAFQARPDAEIAAHWGEVLWHHGSRGEAQRVWNLGLSLDPQNPTLLETLQRLQAPN